MNPAWLLWCGTFSTSWLLAPTRHGMRVMENQAECGVEDFLPPPGRSTKGGVAGHGKTGKSASRCVNLEMGSQTKGRAEAGLSRAAVAKGELSRMQWES
jgi:hypothetical protein